MNAIDQNKKHAPRSIGYLIRLILLLPFGLQVAQKNDVIHGNHSFNHFLEGTKHQ